MNDLIAFLNARIDEDERFLGPKKRHLWQRPFREVEAKRAIVLMATRLPALTRDFDLFDNNRDGWADALRYLAAVYSDHPEYRADWKPTGVHHDLH